MRRRVVQNTAVALILWVASIGLSDDALVTPALSVDSSVSASEPVLEDSSLTSAFEESTRSSSAPISTDELGAARSMQSSLQGGAAFDPALPLGVNGRIAFNASVLWAPTQAVSDQAAELGLVRQNIGLSFPIWFGNEQAVFGGIGVQNIMFQTDAVLPDTGIPFPSNLWDIRGTIVHTRRWANDWSTTLIGSLGATGDEPFASASELIPGVVAVLRIPSGERNAWLASLSYQPVTGLPFPIPGIAYVWQPSDRLTAQVGIPFQLYWGITDRIRFDASYLPVTNIRAYVTARWWPTVETFAGFDWINESYFLNDRLRDDDFFNVLEMRLPIGVRWYVGQHWAFDAQAGYLLDRRFFTGDSIVDPATDEIDVMPGPFGMIRWVYRF